MSYIISDQIKQLLWQLPRTDIIDVYQVIEEDKQKWAEVYFLLKIMEKNKNK